MSEAHEEIRNLLGRYCEAMDAADWAGLGTLFADGALTDDGGTELARGAEAVTAMYAGMVRLYDGSPRTRHLTVNAVLEVQDSTATCRSSFLVLQQLSGGPLEPIAAGRYRDRFRRTAEGWVFAERAFALDQTGDLSRHLGA